jgi:hypothetical protein
MGNLSCEDLLSFETYLLVHSRDIDMILLQVIVRRQHLLDVGDIPGSLVLAHLDRLLGSLLLDPDLGLRLVVSHYE